jgi:Uri superfamily endonuclease
MKQDAVAVAGASTLAQLQAKPGTYILWMQLKQAQSMSIGKLGTMQAQAGVYAYVGSAFGSGGVAARLKHHLAYSAKPRWHLDYLRQHALVWRCWVNHDAQHRECLWAKVLAGITPYALPMPSFGSSDCACTSHLFYFKRAPSLRRFKELLKSYREHLNEPSATPQGCVHEVLVESVRVKNIGLTERMGNDRNLSCVSTRLSTGYR